MESRAYVGDVACVEAFGRSTLVAGPSIATCTTADWFDAWPADALRAVARAKLSPKRYPHAADEQLSGLATVCAGVHLDAREAAARDGALVSDARHRAFLHPTQRALSSRPPCPPVKVK